MIDSIKAQIEILAQDIIAFLLQDPDISEF